MTDQNPEVPQDVVEAIDDQPTEVEVVEAEVEPTEADSGPEAETDVIDAEVVGLDLGDEAPAAPVGTDFDVAESPHLAEAAPIGEFEAVDPVAAVPPAPEVLGGAAPTTPQPAAPPAPAAPTGGSFLDLPPLPDLNYPAATPPPASPYPPPAASYPQAANYPPPANPPQVDYAPYPVDYREQAAGQAYGHGAPAPQRHPAPIVPAGPYGTPTGFAVQPHQQGVPVGDVTLASAAHWGALVATVASGGSLGFLVPLIIMVTKGQSDPLVRANAVESLNFSLTVILGMIVSVLALFVFIGIVGLIAIPILAIILQILGAMAANRGEVYRYPVSIRFVK